MDRVSPLVPRYRTAGRTDLGSPSRTAGLAPQSTPTRSTSSLGRQAAEGCEWPT